MEYIITKIIEKLNFLILKQKIRRINKMVTGGTGKLILKSRNIKINVVLKPNAKFILEGNLILENHLGGENTIYIHIGENACLKIQNDFLIGNGVRINLYKNSELNIGGKKIEKISGITENTKIMVFNSIKIGYDFLCAWDVFISDSDWHSIKVDNNLKTHHKPIIINDHVWVSPGCSILKGTEIGEGSIIGTKTTLSNKYYKSNSIIAGIPASVVKENINWSQEI